MITFYLEWGSRNICVSHQLKKKVWTLYKLECVHAQSLGHVELFCDPTDCSTPGSSVHGISQARILHCIAISSSREIFSTQGSNHGYVSPVLGGRFFTTGLSGKPWKDACSVEKGLHFIIFLFLISMFEFKYKPEKDLEKNVLKMSFPHHSRHKNSVQEEEKESWERR